MLQKDPVEAELFICHKIPSVKLTPKALNKVQMDFSEHFREFRINEGHFEGEQPFVGLIQTKKFTSDKQHLLQIFLKGTSNGHNVPEIHFMWKRQMAAATGGFI